MYKVILYFSFAAIVATKDESPTGEPLLFDTEEEANRFGQSKNIPYEAVKVKENVSA